MTKERKNVLITGGSGKLGKELKKLFPTALIPTHAELDITKLISVTEYVSRSN